MNAQQIIKKLESIEKKLNGGKKLSFDELMFLQSEFFWLPGSGLEIGKLIQKPLNVWLIVQALDEFDPQASEKLADKIEQFETENNPPKSQFVKVRVTPAEKIELEQEAKILKASVSEVIRKKLKPSK